MAANAFGASWADNGMIYFDPGTMEPSSGANSMVEEIMTAGFAGAAQYAFSENGRLVYVQRAFSNANIQLAWVGRDRGIELLPFEPRESSGLDLSPNGRRIALEIEGTDEDGDGDHIWIYDVDRRGSQVVLTTEGDNEIPVWSPDGEWVFFASPRGGNFDIRKRRADQSGGAVLVLDMDAPVRPAAISADWMLLFNSGGGPNGDGWILALDTDSDPTMLLATPAFELMHEFSPDGRFFPYSSDETGQVEVNVREVEGEKRFLVSTSTRGGVGARWPHDAREIYYAPSNGPGIPVAEVDVESFLASAPEEISNIGVHCAPRFGTNFDVTDDGQRFLVRLPANDSGTGTTATGTPQIRIVLNWFEELTERVPTGGSR